MRANPLPHVDPNEAPYAGDNFVRHSGDTQDFHKTQLFVWDAYEKGAEVNLLANPSQAEFLRKQFL